MGLHLPRWVWIGAVALACVAGMVNVIGYLVETVDPGTEIEATLRLPGLALKLGARVPEYWSVPQR